MKKFARFLPFLAAAAGAAANLLRRALLSGADSQGRLPVFSGAAFASWLLTVAVLALIATAAVLLRREKYTLPAPAPLLRLLGSLAGAAGICVTVLTEKPLMMNAAAALYLGSAWRYLGFAAALGLTAAGVCRVLGKKRFFLLHALACLYLVAHCLLHYQSFSSQPQVLSFLLPLLGLVSLLLFSYYVTAGDVGLERRWMRLGTGLAAVYCCLGAMDAYPGLYLGGAVWALTELSPEEGK